MVTYLAGPMTGYPDYNYPAFDKAARQLRMDGVDVVSPHELFKGETGLPWEHYMREGLKVMLDCDGIALLPGWLDSRGARIETVVANACGLRVEYL